MRTPFILAAICAIALSAPAAFAGDHKGEKGEVVKLADVPAVVKTAIEDKAAGGEIVKIEKKTNKEGKVIYMAIVKGKDGHKGQHIAVSESGKLLKNERKEHGDKDAPEAK